MPTVFILLFLFHHFFHVIYAYYGIFSFCDNAIFITSPHLFFIIIIRMRKIKIIDDFSIIIRIIESTLNSIHNAQFTIENCELWIEMFNDIVISYTSILKVAYLYMEVWNGDIFIFKKE